VLLSGRLTPDGIILTTLIALCTSQLVRTPCRIIDDLSPSICSSPLMEVLKTRLLAASRARSRNMRWLWSSQFAFTLPVIENFHGIENAYLACLENPWSSTVLETSNFGFLLYLDSRNKILVFHTQMAQKGREISLGLDRKRGDYWPRHTTCPVN